MTRTSRNCSGSAITMAAAFMVIIVIIGLAFVFITMQVGSKRQTEHAMQSGSLSLMQAVCKVSVPYSSLTSAQQNIVNGAFQGKPPEGISLLNYNQLIGYAMMQSQNAIDDKGGANGSEYSNVQQIMDAIQNDPDSIGQRLITAINKQINDSSFIDKNFTSIANANPTGLAAFTGKKFQVQLKSCTPVYLNQYGSSSNPISNVSVDLNNSAYSSLSRWAQGGPDNTHKNSENNQPYSYVTGYTAIEPSVVAGSGGAGATPYRALYALSINPSEPVHIVAANAITTPKAVSSTASGGRMPPFNGLRLVAVITSGDAIANQTETYVVAGGKTTLNSPILPPSIPGGYIIIKNAPGLNFPTSINVVNVDAAPQNKELMTGVFISNNSLFTTDGSTTTGLIAWAQYNASVKAGTPLPEPQMNSVDPIFNAGGIIASKDELSKVTFVDKDNTITGQSYKGLGNKTTICTQCFWDSFEGKGAVGPCQKLRPSFFAAYGVPNTVTTFPALNITSVEAAKAAFIHAYGYVTQHFAEYDSTIETNTSSGVGLVNIQTPGAGALNGGRGQDDFVQTTITTTSWNKNGTAITLSANGTPGICTNAIGTSPGNDVVVGISGLEKFQHQKYLYASNADTNADFLSFTSQVATPPTDSYNIRSVKIGQSGTLLDYISQIEGHIDAKHSTAKTPVKNLIAPMTTDYPFCNISAAGKATSTNRLMKRETFVRDLKAQLGKDNGTVGAFIRTMHQITPTKDATQFANEVYDILTGPTVPMGKTMYIYADPYNLDPQQVPMLKLSETPPNYDTNITANGTAQIYRSSYTVMGYNINPPKEMAITDQLFTKLLASVGNGTKGNIKGVDQATWTPNTSNNNFLGQLDFASGLEGIEQSDFDVIVSLISKKTTSQVVGSIPN